MGRIVSLQSGADCLQRFVTRFDKQVAENRIGRHAGRGGDVGLSDVPGHPFAGKDQNGPGESLSQRLSLFLSSEFAVPRRS
jgi:hypothetical protein